eukprot:gb/GEZN01000057.1/.p1 GENE.gb/GEZN01000057.1/~~gb/GEZN01000057.1/.p1  ORF type:complete len:2813 (-),score=488.37 gb/GEZN01000057.1/:367-7632(-)
MDADEENAINLADQEDAANLLADEEVLAAEAAALNPEQEDQVEADVVDEEAAQELDPEQAELDEQHPEQSEMDEEDPEHAEMDEQAAANIFADEEEPDPEQAVDIEESLPEDLPNSAVVVAEQPPENFMCQPEQQAAVEFLAEERPIPLRMSSESQHFSKLNSEEKLGFAIIPVDSHSSLPPTEKQPVSKPEGGEVQAQRHQEETTTPEAAEGDVEKVQRQEEAILGSPESDVEEDVISEQEIPLSKQEVGKAPDKVLSIISSAFGSKPEVETSLGLAAEIGDVIATNSEVEHVVLSKQKRMQVQAIEPEAIPPSMSAPLPAKAKQSCTAIFAPNTRATSTFAPQVPLTEVGVPPQRSSKADLPSKPQAPASKVSMPHAITAPLKQKEEVSTNPTPSPSVTKAQKLQGTTQNANPSKVQELTTQKGAAPSMAKPPKPSRPEPATSTSLQTLSQQQGHLGDSLDHKHSPLKILVGPILQPQTPADSKPLTLKKDLPSAAPSILKNRAPQALAKKSPGRKPVVSGPAKRLVVSRTTKRPSKSLKEDSVEIKKTKSRKEEKTMMETNDQKLDTRESNVCPMCDIVVRGKVMKVKEQVYHVACFKCQKCKVGFPDRLFVRHPVTKQFYHKHHMPKYVKKESRSTGCEKETTKQVQDVKETEINRMLDEKKSEQVKCGQEGQDPQEEAATGPEKAEQSGETKQPQVEPETDPKQPQVEAKVESIIGGIFHKHAMLQLQKNDTPDTTDVQEEASLHRAQEGASLYRQSSSVELVGFPEAVSVATGADVPSPVFKLHLPPFTTAVDLSPASQQTVAESDSKKSADICTHTLREDITELLAESATNPEKNALVLQWFERFSRQVLQDGQAILEDLASSGDQVTNGFFSRRGVQYKLVADPKIEDSFLYGGASASPDRAIKAASNQTKAANLYLTYLLRHPEPNLKLSAPVQFLVQHLGRCLVAMPALPATFLDGQSQLVYGSEDHGITVHNLDPALSVFLASAAEELHIAAHLVKGQLLHTAGDTQGHLFQAEPGGKQERVLLNLTRTLPPESCELAAKPSDKTHLAPDQFGVWYRLLRPELLARLKTVEPAIPPVSSDAFSQWGIEDSKVHNQNAIEASRYLFSKAVPKLSESLRLLQQQDETPDLAPLVKDLWWQFGGDEEALTPVILDQLCSSFHQDLGMWSRQQAQPYSLEELSTDLKALGVARPVDELSKVYGVWQISSSSLAGIFHEHGVSMRHLGLVRTLIPMENQKLRQRLRDEAIARTLKHVVRRHLQDLRPDQVRPFLAHFVNTALGRLAAPLRKTVKVSSTLRSKKPSSARAWSMKLSTQRASAIVKVLSHVQAPPSEVKQSPELKQPLEVKQPSEVPCLEEYQPSPAHETSTADKPRSIDASKTSSDVENSKPSTMNATIKNKKRVARTLSTAWQALKSTARSSLRSGKGKFRPPSDIIATQQDAQPASVIPHEETKPAVQAPGEVIKETLEVREELLTTPRKKPLDPSAGTPSTTPLSELAINTPSKRGRSSFNTPSPNHRDSPRRSLSPGGSPPRASTPQKLRALLRRTPAEHLQMELLWHKVDGSEDMEEKNDVVFHTVRFASCLFPTVDGAVPSSETQLLWQFVSQDVLRRFGRGSLSEAEHRDLFRSLDQSQALAGVVELALKQMGVDLPAWLITRDHPLKPHDVPPPLPRLKSMSFTEGLRALNLIERAGHPPYPVRHAQVWDLVAQSYSLTKRLAQSDPTDQSVQGQLLACELLLVIRLGFMSSFLNPLSETQLLALEEALAVYAALKLKSRAPQVVPDVPKKWRCLIQHSVDHPSFLVLLDKVAGGLAMERSLERGDDEAFEIWQDRLDEPLDVGRNTAIHRAIWRGRLGLAARLVMRGCNLSLNAEKGTVLMTACSKEPRIEEELIQTLALLRDAGYDANKFGWEVPKLKDKIQPALSAKALETALQMTGRGMESDAKLAARLDKYLPLSTSSCIVRKRALARPGLIKVPCPGISNQTTLQMAVAQGHCGLTRLLLMLLARGCEGDKHVVAAKELECLWTLPSPQALSELESAATTLGLPVMSLLIAIGKADQSTIQRCLALGVSSAVEETVGSAGPSPLQLAARQGSLSMVMSFLACGSRVDQADERDGRTALWWAAKRGHGAVFTHLLGGYGAAKALNLADSKGQTPLYAASGEGHAQVVSRLILAKACVNKATHDGWAPLHIAASQGRAAVVRILLSAGVKPNPANPRIASPLLMASGKGHTEIVQQLLDAGANFTFAKRDGWTPLLVASHNGNAEVVSRLIRARANIDETKRDGASSLYLAAWKGHNEVVEVLLKAGANVNQAEEEGWTPLCIASQQGHSKTVLSLLAAKASVQQATPSGWTPLHGAASEGHVAVVELLVEAGALRSARTSRGTIAAELAEGAGHLGIAARLRKPRAGKPRVVE